MIDVVDDLFTFYSHKYDKYYCSICNPDKIQKLKESDKEYYENIIKKQNEEIIYLKKEIESLKKLINQ